MPPTPHGGKNFLKLLVGGTITTREAHQGFTSPELANAFVGSISVELKSEMEQWAMARSRAFEWLDFIRLTREILPGGKLGVVAAEWQVCNSLLSLQPFRNTAHHEIDHQQGRLEIQWLERISLGLENISRVKGSSGHSVTLASGSIQF